MCLRKHFKKNCGSSCYSTSVTSPSNGVSSCVNKYYNTQINLSVESENNITGDNKDYTTDDLNHID